jgi:transglutaminase superfamily protein
MRRRPAVRELRAALWTLRAVRSARRQLRRSGYEGLTLPRVPSVSGSASRGVNAVLRRLPATCLERAVVLQRWRTAHDDPCEVVVGVTGTREEFRAHAWLDDESPADIGPFRELVRLRP